MQFVFRVELNQPGLEQEREAVESLLPELAVTALELRSSRREEKRRQLVELFLGDVQPTPLDVRRARLEAQAHRAILTGTEWLTASQIAELAQLGSGNPAGISRWKQQGRIFAIRRDGKDYYPRYGLDDDFHPLPALKDVIRALPHYSHERLAGWFESGSGYLDGQRPRELLATDPQRVLEAARDAAESEESAG